MARTLEQARQAALKALARYSRANKRLATMRKNIEKYAFSDEWARIMKERERAWGDAEKANAEISKLLRR